MICPHDRNVSRETLEPMRGRLRTRWRVETAPRRDLETIRKTVEAPAFILQVRNRPKNAALERDFPARATASE